MSPAGRPDSRFLFVANLAVGMVVAMSLGMALLGRDLAPWSARAAEFYACLLVYAALAIWGNVRVLGETARVVEGLYFFGQVALYASS